MSERWNEAYTERVDIYERFERFYHSEEGYAQLVNQRTPLGKKVILDVGAGTGDMAISLARFGRKVYALESSPQMVSVIISKVKESGLSNVEVLAEDCECISLAGSSVDVATASHSIGATDRLLCLREMERVIVDGGQIYAFENWAFEDSTFQIMRERESVEYDKAFVKFMTEQGFAVSKVIKVYWDFPSIQEAAQVLGFLLGPKAKQYITNKRIRRIDNRVCLLVKMIRKR
ncbi:methyltransferase domain-containing protein [Candidatus Bathyarchaeota archaeon]|nr:methyltransferase domain-containing protein [Candidatus Bathyarchaeota archaeon]